MTLRTAVRASGPDDVAACAAIIERSPDYFTPNVPDEVARDMAEHRSWVATTENRVIAFAVVSTRFPRAAEVLWAAVDPEHRGQGVGTTLITSTLADLAAAGVRLVEVKTLDPSAGYEPYEATYAFWTARGFQQIDRIDPPADWDQSNPAAVLVRCLPSGDPRRGSAT